MNKHTMTDAEVIKALECCSKSFGNCDGCPYDDDNVDCVTLKGETLMLKDALDLINRQQAEIKQLETIERVATKTIEKQTAEIERLNIRNKALTDITKNYDWKFAKVKSEAIKEFAEDFEYFVLHEDPEINDLKCKDYESYMGGVNQFRLQIVKGIDNLVKEMTEVKEN